MGAADAARGLGESGVVATVGGAARLATLVSSERERAPTVLVDAGDLLEGTSFFPRFGGEPEMRVASALPVDALVLGNHDVAQGVDRVAAVHDRVAAFPLLGANLGPELASGFVSPFAELERGGVRVLVIGLSRRDTGFPDVAESAAAVNGIVLERRASADVVIVLSHLGRELDLELVPRTFGVDLVVGGHTHDVLVPPRFVTDCDVDVAARFPCEPRPVPVVHPGAYGRYVGKAEFVVSTDPAEGARGSPGAPSAIVDARFSLLPVTEAVAERADVSSLLAPYRAVLSAEGDGTPIAYAPDTLSRRAVRRGDSALGDAVADALRIAAQADAAVVNSTGIRADVLAGPVSTGDVTRVLPFADELVVVRTTGESLRAALRPLFAQACDGGGSSPVQIAGLSLDVTCSPLSVELPGAPGGTLRVAAPSYLVNGRWLEPHSADDVEPGPGTVRDAWVSVIRSAPTCGETGGGLPCLRGTADGRIRIR